MSEHWKSTPKYWCKHCSTYVRDTKFEKTQHEATAKHQGNLKRFLRDLHRGHEREERDQQRAKDEVERLNRVVLGASDAPATRGQPAQLPKRTPLAPASAPPQVSLADRKRQMAQLAEMGIAIPDEYRGGLAMAGEWQTISQKRIGPELSEGSLNVGVRKRKIEGQDEEEEAGDHIVRRGWGSTTRRYPGSKEANDPGLDALLGSGRISKKEDGSDSSVVKTEKVEGSEINVKQEAADCSVDTPVKSEDTHPNQSIASIDPTNELNDVPVDVVFKKRKPKTIRQK